MNWLGHEGWHFVQTLTGDEQERSKTIVGLFSILHAKFKLQHNKTKITVVWQIKQGQE